MNLAQILRRHARAPAFTLIVLLLVGTAVAINATTFGALHAVRWKSLPFADGDRLVELKVEMAKAGFGFALADRFRDALLTEERPSPARSASRRRGFALPGRRRHAVAGVARDAGLRAGARRRAGARTRLRRRRREGPRRRRAAVGRGLALAFRRRSGRGRAQRALRRRELHGGRRHAARLRLSRPPRGRVDSAGVVGAGARLERAVLPRRAGGRRAARAGRERGAGERKTRRAAGARRKAGAEVRRGRSAAARDAAARTLRRHRQDPRADAARRADPARRGGRQHGQPDVRPRAGARARAGDPPCARRQRSGDRRRRGRRPGPAAVRRPRRRALPRAVRTAFAAGTLPAARLAAAGRGFRLRQRSRRHCRGAGRARRLARHRAFAPFAAPLRAAPCRRPGPRAQGDARRAGDAGHGDDGQRRPARAQRRSTCSASIAASTAAAC